jgi:peroxiredoxin
MKGVSMNKRESLVWRCIVFVISVAMFLTGCPSNQEGKQQNLKAFDFSLKTIEGEEIQLKSYQGEKIVHLVFWATWCPSCLMELPKLKNLYYAAENKPYEVLSIDVGLNDSIERVKQTQARYQLPYKILFDGTGEVSRRYGIIGVPTHIIINKEGMVIDRFNQLPENPKTYLAQVFSQ